MKLRYGNQLWDFLAYFALRGRKKPTEFSSFCLKRWLKYRITFISYNAIYLCYLDTLHVTLIFDLRAPANPTFLNHKIPIISGVQKINFSRYWSFQYFCIEVVKICLNLSTMNVSFYKMKINRMYEKISFIGVRRTQQCVTNVCLCSPGGRTIRNVSLTASILRWHLLWPLHCVTF